MTTVISAHQPWQSEAEGPVEMQELCYLQEKGETKKDPHEKYDEDLKDLVKEFNAQGHNIILMGDFNLPIHEVNSFTSKLKDWGL